MTQHSSFPLAARSPGRRRAVRGLPGLSAAALAAPVLTACGGGPEADPDKRPITSAPARANLQGAYSTNPNLIAAGALMTAIPTLLAGFTLQRQFISGLTIGSSKG